MTETNWTHFLTVGSKFDVKPSQSKKWCLAKVTEIKQHKNSIKIKFSATSIRDQWINLSTQSSQIAAPYTHTMLPLNKLLPLQHINDYEEYPKPLYYHSRSTNTFYLILTVFHNKDNKGYVLKYNLNKSIWNRKYAYIPCNITFKLRSTERIEPIIYSNKGKIMNPKYIAAQNDINHMIMPLIINIIDYSCSDVIMMVKCVLLC